MRRHSDSFWSLAQSAVNGVMHFASENKKVLSDSVFILLSTLSLAVSLEHMDDSLHTATTLLPFLEEETEEENSSLKVSAP